MAGSKSQDWGDLDITKEEIDNLSEALKKEEFRKLLTEYAEEVTDPKNKKQYQDDIIQLEAERGVDCKFINPEPGFVIKTSVEGKKKAFINICKNSNIEKPTSKPVIRDTIRGLSWSIPYSQAPGREDLDKKRNRCVVYDVVFHPDTLYLADNNTQFRKMVVDTALNAVEDAYNVQLDKHNIKYPKLKFKGMAQATVIRRKSEKPVIMSQEDIEFHKQMNYPITKEPLERDARPPVKDLSSTKPNTEKYAVPHYVIKHRSSVDLEEFVNDKNAKMNSTIPKQLVVEINLPLLNSTNQVFLDVMEKSLHLKCDMPVKYKLDLELPYKVHEKEGTAKFHQDKRLLEVMLPVQRGNFIELQREDSGVESDYGDRFNSGDDASPEGSLTHEASPPYLVECDAISVKDCVKVDPWTRDNSTDFLDADKHYMFPNFVCNTDRNLVCFVLNVKYVDESSVKKKVTPNSLHVKFSSIGSGFFPMTYAFYIKLQDCEIDNGSTNVEVWDNNVTIQLQLNLMEKMVSQYYVGVDEESAERKLFDEVLQLKQEIEKVKMHCRKVLDVDDDDDDVDDVAISVKSATTDQVTISITPPIHKPDSSNLQVSDPIPTQSKPKNLKHRAYSESNGDDINPLTTVQHKSILKNRINRSLSESSADDYVFSSPVEGMLSGSDSCIPEEDEENKDSKKTVRFSDRIHKQLFRANSSILGQRRKNQKRMKNKKKAMERRASESENSEGEDRERRVGGEGDASPGRDDDYDDDDIDDCDVIEPVIPEENETNEARGAKCDFKSDLIFDLDI